MSMQTHVNAVTPTDQDVALARKSSRILSNISLKKTKSIDIVFQNAKDTPITLPTSAFNLLVNIITQMAEGNTITVTPIHAELTTQEAADFLNVSRPYLIRLLEKKQIPSRKVGKHRKILFQDALSYKAKIDNSRRKILNELAQEGQKLNQGY